MTLTADAHAWTLDGAPPLFAAARSDLPTDGAQVQVVAESLGTPLMPWQTYVADVAGERLPSGAYRFPIVVVSVPRQSGKTTLMRAVGVARGLRRPGLEVFYTAQTGKDARERWTDLIRQVATSRALNGRCRTVKRAGAEALVLPNQSAFRCFAPTAASLHGYTPPIVMLDEAFAHDAATGDDLMGAIVPAQSTITHRQLWIVSTAGTADSVFLRRWIDAGLAGESGVGLFLWAASDDTDVYDPASWPTFHPAIGQTIGVDDIAAAASSLSRAEFMRAYGNRWTSTNAAVIDAAAWDALGADVPWSADAPTMLTYDVAHDRKSATLLATWTTGDGIPAARVVQAGPGYSWLAAAVVEQRDALGAQVGADDGGPAREVTDELRRRGVPVDTLGARDYATASSALLGRIDHARVRHDGTDLFSKAAAAVALRPMGDGVAISRRHSPGDVSPMVALAVGCWLLDRMPEPEAPPLIYLGRNDV